MSNPVSSDTPIAEKTTKRKPSTRPTENVRKRGKKSQVRLLLNGEQVTRTFATHDAAVQWRDLMRGKQLDGDLAGFHQAQGLTLRTAILKYRDSILASDKENAEQQQLSRLKVLAEQPGTDIPFLEVLPNNLKVLFSTLAAKGPKGKKLANNTMRLYFAALSAVYKHFIFGEEWQFLSNPLSGLKRPEVGPGRKRRLNDDEEDRIVTALTEYGPAYALTFMLLISTTMRMGELFSLTWAQFDEERAQMNIEVSKTGARECPLSVESIELLSRLPRINQMVIPITRDAFEMAWKRIMPRLEIINLRRHDMRREGLSRWGQRGIDVVNLMRISGHKTMSQAQKYLVGTTEEARAAMNDRLADDPFLKHVKVTKTVPKASMLRHFHAELPPANPDPSPIQPMTAAPKSNVVAFPLAAARAMVAPTRRNVSR